jgi:predicted amino acid racemase
LNQLKLDLLALRSNIHQIDRWVMSHKDASWALVTKVLCGHAGTLRALSELGVRSMADSRLGNLAEIADLEQDIETWYLRPPHLPVIADVVRLSDVSLNSETSIIEALNEAAGRQGKIHRIVIMIELGDLREGVLPGSLLGFYEHVFELPNIEVIGIGSNLGCLSGAIPSVEQFSQLLLYHELLELKFKRKLPVISAGTSAALALLRDGGVPEGINHFRIGESAFLGTDLVKGGILEGLRDDVITLEADVVEIREKSLAPGGETTDMMPFESFDTSEMAPGSRGYRAVVTVGQLDTDIGGLTPMNQNYTVVGASSDLAVVNVGDNPDRLVIGDTIKFRVAYGALVRLFLSKYIDKVLMPPLDYFLREKDDARDVHLPPTLRAPGPSEIVQDRTVALTPPDGESKKGTQWNSSR